MRKKSFLNEKGGTFIIAEVGINFRMGTLDRDLAMSQTMIALAADAGVDAVKFQSFNSERQYAVSEKMTSYLGMDHSLDSVVKDLELHPDLLLPLSQSCKKHGLKFLSTPFSKEDLTSIEPYIDIIKIASSEINHIPLLVAAAKTGKPIIVSTGASDFSDIELAVQTLKEKGALHIALLQCTASYPAPPEAMHLRCMPTLGEKFSLPYGLSDHSEDPVVGPVVALSLGATIIEKHYTLDKNLPGPDHSFSVDPEGLKKLVLSVRKAEKMLGDSAKEVKKIEEEVKAFARRALHAKADIKKGDTLSLGTNFDVLRPGFNSPGLHPKYVSAVEGKRALCNIAEGEGIQLSCFEKE